MTVSGVWDSQALKVALLDRQTLATQTSLCRRYCGPTNPLNEPVGF
jgi:hypothetical protein